MPTQSENKSSQQSISKTTDVVAGLDRDAKAILEGLWCFCQVGNQKGIDNTMRLCHGEGKFVNDAARYVTSIFASDTPTFVVPMGNDKALVLFGSSAGLKTEGIDGLEKIMGTKDIGIAVVRGARELEYIERFNGIASDPFIKYFQLLGLKANMTDYKSCRVTGFAVVSGIHGGNFENIVGLLELAATR